MSGSANARVLVEVAVDSLAAAKAAAAAGAHRLELCAHLDDAGLSPSLGLVQAVVAAVDIPVFAMVRPRRGDFLYDADDFAVMLRDVQLLRENGAAGIVSGVLLANGHVDAARLRELTVAASPLPFTCHRAFDLCADPRAALETLVACGVRRVLTSGQAASATAGAAAIRQCVADARGRLVVLAGAGVRPDNVAALVAATGVAEVHLSASHVRASGMTFRRAGVPMGTTPLDEHALRTTDPAMVAAVVRAVNPSDGTSG